MFWKKKETKTDDNKKSNNTNEHANNSQALVRQDPRTKVKTTSAATESTNTYVQNATLLNSNTNTVTYSSTRQTVTHTQQARITEMVTRRTPTVEELKELFAQINFGADSAAGDDGDKAKRSSTASSTTTATSAAAGRNRPPHLNAVALQSTPSFKRTSHNSLSPLAFKFEMPTDGNKRSSTIIKMEHTTVTQKNGRSVTQHVEEQRIKLKPATKSGGGGGAFKATSKTKTKTTTKQPTANGDIFSYSDARVAALTAPQMSWRPATTTTMPATTTLSTYSSPYAKRPLTGGSSSSLFTTSALPSNSTSTAATIGSTYAYKPATTLAGNSSSSSSTYTARTVPPTGNSTASSSSYAYKPPASLAALKTKSPQYTTSIKANTNDSNADARPQLISTFGKPTSTSNSSITSSLSSSSTKKQSKLKPGCVYIFNHEKFDDPKNEFRVGSSVDVNALCDTFKHFKCKVKIIKNATVDMVKKTVASIESKDYNENSCLVIVILSHGTRHDYIAAKDGDYSIDDNFLFPILRNRTLNDKPKLFFVQACKGAMEVGKFHKDAAQPHGAPNEIFKCYSTFEGYASYRTQEGSIFIQAFCERLKRYGHTKDIREIMSDVALAVKQQSQDKQIPTSTSNMTRSYIFGDYL